ncbi:MAG: Ig-like domain-containing protein, partial [Lachnospiraceae bacterium]|nr:Ig-like domain-containing protein [Lachnospiraceae bacterium]
KAVSDDADGAWQAGYDFCYNFERPSDKENRSKERGNLAKNTYYPKYKDYSMEPGEGETPSENPLTGETFYLPAKGTLSLKELVTEFVPKKWKSDSSKLVSVNKKGKVKAKKATGDSFVTITALSAGKDPQQKTFKIYVETPKVTGEKTIRTFDGFSLPSRLEGLSKVTPKGYASSNSNVLSINENTGEVTVIKNGTARLSVIFEGRKLVTTFKVRTPGIKQSTTKIKTNKTKKLTIQNKNKSVSLSFNSANPDIATVDDNGKIYANAPGETTISLYVNSSSEPYDTCEITVK